MQFVSLLLAHHADAFGLVCHRDLEEGVMLMRVEELIDGIKDFDAVATEDGRQLGARHLQAVKEITQLGIVLVVSVF